MYYRAKGERISVYILPFSPEEQEGGTFIQLIGL